MARRQLSLFIAIVILSLTVITYKNRPDDQYTDFVTDLEVMGFAGAEPVWVQETISGITQSSLKADVMVAGCRITLERGAGESRTKRVDGRSIKRYIVTYGDQAVRIDDVAPTIQVIKDHLSNPANFPCFSDTA